MARTGAIIDYQSAPCRNGGRNGPLGDDNEQVSRSSLESSDSTPTVGVKRTIDLLASDLGPSIKSTLIRECP